MHIPFVHAPNKNVYPLITDKQIVWRTIHTYKNACPHLPLHVQSIGNILWWLNDSYFYFLLVFFVLSIAFQSSSTTWANIYTPTQTQSWWKIANHISHIQLNSFTHKRFELPVLTCFTWDAKKDEIKSWHFLLNYFIFKNFSPIDKFLISLLKKYKHNHGQIF